MTPPRSILVFHTSFIGDLVLALPLLQTLRRTWPGTRIDIVAIPAAAALLNGHPALTEVISYDKRGTERGIQAASRLARRLRATGYEAALVPHRSLRSAAIVLAAGIPRRIGFTTSAGRMLFTSTVPYRPDHHESARDCDLLAPLGISPVPGELPLLFPSNDDRAAVDRLFAGWPGVQGRILVALAPGSVWETKRWPGYSMLAQMLIDRGFALALIGGTADADLCDSLARALPADRIVNCAGRLTPLQSAEVIRRSAVIVSNDSAPTHLGVAVRTPVVALYGATVPAFGFAPQGAFDTVVQTEGLSCRPCAIHGGKVCPIGTFVCMNAIAPSRVLSAVDDVITRAVPTVTLAGSADAAVRAAADVVRQGGVIVYPTETIYGVGADASNKDAVGKVFKAKRRHDGKPVLVLLPSADSLEPLAASVPPAARALMAALWPGPLTLIFRSSGCLPAEVTQGSGTIGVRVPSSEFCRRLLVACGRPLVSTSANISGEPAPRTVTAIQRAFGKDVDLYVEAGVLADSPPSTVVDVTGERLRIVRVGAITKEQIAHVVPDIVEG
jgi:heptosyltransferase-2